MAGKGADVSRAQNVLAAAPVTVQIDWELNTTKLVQSLFVRDADIWNCKFCKKPVRAKSVTRAKAHYDRLDSSIATCPHAPEKLLETVEKHWQEVAKKRQADSTEEEADSKRPKQPLLPFPTKGIPTFTM